MEYAFLDFCDGGGGGSGRLVVVVASSEEKQSESDKSEGQYTDKKEPYPFYLPTFFEKLSKEERCN